MRTPAFHRIVALATTLLLSATFSSTAHARVVSQFPTLAAPTISYALHAKGDVVRNEGGIRVTRIALDATQRVLAGTASVFRVRIQGPYAPRALRYVVRSDGDPVAYGIPAPTGRAVLAVTADASVVTGRITVRAGSGPDSGPTTLAGAPSPGVGNGDLGSRTPGSHDVTRASYDFGDQAYQPMGLGGRVELRADVHYPTDLAGGPYPLVLFLHGNHAACYRGDRAGYDWPCPDGWRPLPNYKGYNYIARRLASYGFIVVSVSGNGVNVLGNQVADTGMRQRGLLLEKHFDLWNEWNTVGGDPFGTTFVGAVDMTHTGVMGHSRGGEGAVWNALVDQQRAVPYGLDAVLALAPVDFTRVTVNDVALGVMLPDCDGDVSDLQGIHFFDDSRYAVAGDTSPKATVTVFKANHNFFNTVWSPSSGYPGAFNDAYNCPNQLTETAQRRVGATYIVSFFRRYVGGERGPGELWTGARTPAVIEPARTAVSYLAPDRPTDRMDVARLDRPTELATDHLGGDIAVNDMGAYGWCSNVYDTPCVPGPLGGYDIHRSWSWFGPVGPGLQEGLFGWSATAGGDASVRFSLPAGSRDVSGFDELAFRTMMNPGYDANWGINYQDFDIVLEDTTGARATVAAADVGNDVLGVQLTGRSRPSGHLIMNQIRFPLTDFRGVDLTRIRSVTFAFDRVASGVIDVSDLAFQRLA
ncbi:MAG: hypothetical protein ABJB55_04600 [Actinomycetota bacterium]